MSETKCDSIQYVLTQKDSGFKGKIVVIIIEGGRKLETIT